MELLLGAILIMLIVVCAGIGKILAALDLIIKQQRAP